MSTVKAIKAALQLEIDKSNTILKLNQVESFRELCVDYDGLPIGPAEYEESYDLGYEDGHYAGQKDGRLEFCKNLLKYLEVLEIADKSKL